jgi:hypothetical protein
MTDLITEPVPFSPTRRPVRRFVSALVLIALACVLLWWAGLLAPRASASLLSGSLDRGTPRGTVVVRVRNGGPLPLTVLGVRVDDAGVVVEQVRADGGDVASSPVELGPGQTVRLEVDRAVACQRPRAYGPDPRPRVVVRSPVGRQRAVVVRGLEPLSCFTGPPVP